MTSYGFYQLMTRQLDAVVPRLLEKVLAAGHRVLLVGDDRAERHAVDLGEGDVFRWRTARDNQQEHEDRRCHRDDREPA